MDLITINIAGKESISLVCSQCGCAREINVSNLPDIGKVYKVKCKCIHPFSVAFDKRKDKRKRTKLIGTYFFEHSMTDSIIDVVDLSRGGIAFIRTDNNTLKIGDRLIIRFNLDNLEQDTIECVITIRNILGNRVCGQFLDMRGGMNRMLGFYML
ncbi:MAG: PilZ domain-containing protein [Syntrophobacteraceae bacterium]